MANKIKVRYKDKLVDATIIEPTHTSERWNTYLLEDGSTIGIKLVALQIVRIDGEYDAEGSPVYLVKSKNVLNVTPSEDLRNIE